MSRQLHRSVIKEQLAPFWVDMCHLLSRCCLLQCLHFLIFQREDRKLKLSFLKNSHQKLDGQRKRKASNPAGHLQLPEILVTIDVKMHLPFCCTGDRTIWLLISDSIVNNEGISFGCLSFFFNSIENISSFPSFLQTIQSAQSPSTILSDGRNRRCTSFPSS